jgi:hypothetical protein
MQVARFLYPAFLRFIVRHLLLFCSRALGHSACSRAGFQPDDDALARCHGDVTRRASRFNSRPMKRAGLQEKSSLEVEGYVEYNGAASGRRSFPARKR